MWQREAIFGGRDHKLRVGSERRRAYDRLALTEPVYARADGHHLTAEFVAGNEWQRRFTLVLSLYREQIRESHGERPVSDQDFAATVSSR